MAIKSGQLLKLFELVYNSQLSPQKALDVVLGKDQLPEESKAEQSPAEPSKPKRKRTPKPGKPAFLISIKKPAKPKVEKTQPAPKEKSVKEPTVQVGCVYPVAYQGPKSIGEQIKKLAKIFRLNSKPALEFAKHLPPLPDGAEGWFAVPSLEALMNKYCQEFATVANRYRRAIKLVQEKIMLEWPLLAQGSMLELRLSARTIKASELIAKVQPGDIQIIAAQLGMRYGGKSVAEASEQFAANEFGLGSVAVGAIILTHLERIKEPNSTTLHMNCTGDEDPLGKFIGVPLYMPDSRFHDSEIFYISHINTDRYAASGPVSGFIPPAWEK